MSDSDRLSALEQQLAVMQREVSNFEARAAQAPAKPASPASSAAAPSAAAVPSNDALSWPLADSALGLDVNGATVSGNTYTVDKAWLAAELTLLRLPGRAPVLAPAPGGVAVRAVKPKSLAAKLGFQNGDTIVAIDGKPVQTAADISAALHAASGNQTKVKLLRKKTETELIYRLN